MQWNAATFTCYLLMLAGGIALNGCGSEQQPAPPATQNSQSPSTTEPVQPAASVLSVDGRPIAFPTSVLRVTKGDESMSLMLYTPDTALADDRTANTVLITTTVDDIAGRNTPAGDTVHLTGSPQDSETDTINGFSLDGGATQWLVSEVDITFTAVGDGWITLAVRGTFWSTDAKGDKRTSKVDGVLWASVQSPQDGSTTTP